MSMLAELVEHFIWLMAWSMEYICLGNFFHLFIITLFIVNHHILLNKYLSSTFFLTFLLSLSNWKRNTFEKQTLKDVSLRKRYTTSTWVSFLHGEVQNFTTILLEIENLLKIWKLHLLIKLVPNWYLKILNCGEKGH